MAIRASHRTENILISLTSLEIQINFQHERNVLKCNLQFNDDNRKNVFMFSFTEQLLPCESDSRSRKSFGIIWTFCHVPLTCKLNHNFPLNSNFFRAKRWQMMRPCFSKKWTVWWKSRLLLLWLIRFVVDSIYFLFTLDYWFLELLELLIFMTLKLYSPDNLNLAKWRIGHVIKHKNQKPQNLYANLSLKNNWV